MEIDGCPMLERIINEGGFEEITEETDEKPKEDTASKKADTLEEEKSEPATKTETKDGDIDICSFGDVVGKEENIKGWGEMEEE